MKKQIKVSLLTCAAVLSAAAMAQAAPAELNIYGASAQYLYWNAQAQNYAQTVLGCTATAPVNNGGKHGFVSATNCTSTLVPVNSATGKRDLDIRYSGIASAEGPLAVSGQNALDATLSAGCATGERKMYASATTTVCKKVHVGTSDVAGETLTQSSSGNKFGPLGGGAFSASLAGVNTTGLTPANTVVVPFGFFINKAVTATKCTAGLVGNYATAASQCDTAPGKGDGALGSASTIDNISREQAVMIFTGQSTDWSDFGSYFTAQPVVACLRHAGSGTHSAFDATVINSGWGGNILTAEETGRVWFNQGSGDEIKCINGNTTAATTGSLIGAIGYADADQATGVAATSQNVLPIKYNGVYPTRSAIRNGLYDFYTNAWLYTNPANGVNYPTMGTSVNDIAASLITFAQDPANVPASKANYWAAVGEMKYNRGTDAGYPGYVGASIPQLP